MNLKKIMLVLLLIVTPVCAFGMGDESNNLPPESTAIGVAVATIKEYLDKHPGVELSGVASFSIVLGAVVGQKESALAGFGTTIASLCTYGSYKLFKLNEKDEY